ncbi:MAG: hypothetical protein L0Z54_05895 [Thermoplasmata archaeon]|nr:hypothetical protein [Thermoplasmata archaeon]
MPVDIWVERRSLGRRGLRAAALAMTVIVASVPLSLLAVPAGRDVPATAWASVLFLTALLAMLLARSLLLAGRPSGAYVTSLSYIFIRRPPETEVEALVGEVLRERRVRAGRTEVDGFPAWANDEVSIVMLAGGRFPGVGGIAARDHTGDNIGLLRALHGAASDRWGLDRSVANGKRVVPRRRGTR